MTQFVELNEKGLDRCLLQSSLKPGLLHLHVTELPAGARSHDPHRHDGIEAIYLLEGSGTVETENGPIVLTPNQAVILDAGRMHGLVNTSDAPMRYLVIMSKP